MEDTAERRREFQVTVRVKNNLLLSRRNEYMLTVVKMAKAIGIPMAAYSSYENMKASPVDEDGIVKKHAQAILNFLDVDFEEIWPEAVLQVKCSSMTKELYSEELALAVHSPRHLLPDEALAQRELGDEVQTQLSRLMPREEKILRDRVYKDMTLEEIAADFEVNRERIRQIECKALRKLRHPSMSRALRAHSEGTEGFSPRDHIKKILEEARETFQASQKSWEEFRARIPEVVSTAYRRWYTRGPSPDVHLPGVARYDLAPTWVSKEVRCAVWQELAMQVESGAVVLLSGVVKDSAGEDTLLHSDHYALREDLE